MARMNQAMNDLFRYNSALLPQKRSSFNKSHSHATTFDSGYLIPLMWDRVLPGDEKKIRYSGLARMATPIHPVMDEANLDVWAFYIPDRLWYADAKKFYGENLDASFNPDGEYQMPYLTPNQFLVGDSTNGVGSLSDYFGFPYCPDNKRSTVGALDMKVTAGLHRSYQLIWNEWFRNSSVQGALRLNDGPTVSNAEWDIIKLIRKVCKYPDYFTTLLRQPQAGDNVSLPIGEWAPVVTRDVRTVNGVSPEGVYPYSSLEWVNRYGNLEAGGDSSGNLMAFHNLDETSTVTDGVTGVYASSDYTGQSYNEVLPSNLWADLTSVAGATINNLRSAITVQQLLEIDAIGGKRYQNLIQAHFGVLTPDATLQRPELLGATRTPIGMRQVLQTSATDDTSPQGNTAAFSLTNVANEWICNKAFTEPGFIMVLGAVRPVHSYSQGIDPLLTKLDRYDHYYPVFDNLGNQPVPKSAIYFGAKSNASNMNATLGYQEAWSEYRIKQNRVSGLMRPDVPETLASWNYSSFFNDVPTLNSDFVSEDPDLMDRVIAVPSEPQFLLDSYFDYIDVKNMSVHSVPGLLRL